MMRTESLAAAAFDALPTQTAVLDADGVIRDTNDAWATFGAANEFADAADPVGDDYLAQCDAADDEHARVAATGIRAVLAGDRDTYEFEYPCHSPTEDRWFTMYASRFTHDGETHALVAHFDVTERRHSEDQVRERRDQLEALASVLSHDLRNPMEVARGRAELLDAETDSEHVAHLQSALDRMAAIVEDALTLARGGRVESVEPVDLGEVARTAWGHVETGDATLSVAATRELAADPDLLAQLFENLFRNAIEHAGPEVEVTVAATDGGSANDGRERADGAEDERSESPGGFTVADDGPGIPESDRDVVFEPGHTTESGGNGLGLAIVERVAAAHGWTVTVGESDAGGARFTVSDLSTP